MVDAATVDLGMMFQSVLYKHVETFTHNVYTCFNIRAGDRHEFNNRDGN